MEVKEEKDWRWRRRRNGGGGVEGSEVKERDRN